MEIGIVGLGRMGGNIARRLIHAGHRCVVNDHNPQAVAAIAAAGATGAGDNAALIAALAPPRAIWLMLPAGAITEKVGEVGFKIDCDPVKREILTKDALPYRSRNPYRTGWELPKL